MNEESHNPSIEPELEARIVALVLGEASDFESDALNRLITLRPELAAFKFRMQSVHGMLQDLGAGEFEAPEEDWKLPADRRNAVLAVIRGEATVQPAELDHIPVGKPNSVPSPRLGEKVADRPDEGLVAAPMKSMRRWRRNLTKVAAVLCVAGFFGIMALPSFFNRESMLANRRSQRGISTNDAGTRMAITVVPHDEMTLSGGAILKFNVSDGSVAADGELDARSGAGDRDQKKNSKSALSAIRDSLGSGATLPSPGYLTDDVEYFPKGPVFKQPEATIAQDNSMALEKWDRAAATIVDGSSSTRMTTEDSTLIAKNEGAWRFKGVAEGDRSGRGLAEHQPASPDSIYPDLPFPMAAYGFGEARIPALTESAPSVNGPGGEAVRLGALERPSVLSSTLSAGEASAVTPRIIIQDEQEELIVSGMPQGAGNAKRAWGRSSIPQPGEGFRESLLGERDLLSRTATPGQPLAEESVRELTGAIPEFSKDQLDLEAGRRSRFDGNTFSFEGESKLIENIDIAGTTGPASEAEDKSLAGNLPSHGGRGLGRYVDDPAAGYSGFGSGGFALNLPSDQFGEETPAAAKGFAEGRMDGIASSDDSGIENSSRSKVPAQNPMVKMKAAVEWSDKQGLQSLNEWNAQADLADGSVALNQNGDAKKSDGEMLAGAVAGKDTDWIEKDNKGIEMPDAGGVGLFDRIGVDFDFNVQDTPGKPADIRAFRSRQLTFSGKKEGRGGEIQDGRMSGQTSQPSGPVTAKSLRNFTVKNGRVNRLPAEPNAQLIESQRKSGELTDEYSKRTFRYVLPTLDDDSKSTKKLSEKTVAPPAGLNEKTAAEEAFSTFSLHVSDVSFKLAQAALARGEWPEAAKIRIEEFVNAFDYGDPLPCNDEKVACRVEQSIHPFVQQRNLLRISMRTAASGRATNTPLRLTFLLDNSGSMERTDRQQTVRRAFALLAQQLTPIDQVTLISFARQPRLLADKVSGADAGQLVRFIDELPSEGGTNIEAALQLAYEKAREQQSSDGQNRIILLTDGAVNLGNANPESLSQMVTTMRTTGIAFDAAGISAEGLNDEILEALTRKGDGRYYLLDSLEDADDGFARQIAGALRPSAKNVKVQIEFNPKRVGHYKLLGFEKHILKTEDFRNDKVDAAEMAAAEAGVALYQFEAKPDGEGDVGSVSVRFQDLSTGQMIENRWPIPYEADAPRPDQAAPSLRIATSAAMLAAKLRGEPLGETVDLQSLSQLVSGLPEQERNDTRVQQLQQMIEQARQLSAK